MIGSVNELISFKCLVFFLRPQETQVKSPPGKMLKVMCLLGCVMLTATETKHNYKGNWTNARSYII